MVFHDRPVYQEEHAAQLIVARRICLHRKAEYICADLSIDPSLFPCSQTADHTFQGITSNRRLTSELRESESIIVNWHSGRRGRYQSLYLGGQRIDGLRKGNLT